jgi:hypothetical protein
VLHRAVDHVRHGLEAAMRMVGEAGDVVVRIVGLELVEEQERIEHRERAAAERAIQAHACAVRGALRRDDALDRAIALRPRGIDPRRLGARLRIHLAARAEQREAGAGTGTGEGLATCEAHHRREF